MIRELTASDVAHRIRAGELTSESRVRSCLIVAYDVDRASRTESCRSDSQGSHGLPLGVQLIAVPGADELLLQVGQWASQALAAA
jgi:hypothetical protein